MSPSSSFGTTLLSAAALLSASVVFSAAAMHSAAIAQSPVTADQAASQTGEDLVLGRNLFLRYCAECHGASGDGYGPRENITYARPRSFTTGRFKLSTTENQVPSDSDLMQAIRHGMPGSGMPSWSQLPEDEIMALAEYVRSLGIEPLRESLAELVSAGALSVEEAAERLAERTVPGEPISIPPEPEVRDLERGGEMYRESCVPCHGVDGDAPPGLLRTDLEGNWLPPTSLRTGLFKGGSEPRQIYARIWKGLDGTAMPGFEGAYSRRDLWHLVHYVQALPKLPKLTKQEPASATASAALAEPAEIDEVASEPAAPLTGVNDPRLPEPGGPIPHLDRWIAVFVLLAGGAYLFAILRPRAEVRSGPRREP